MDVNGVKKVKSIIWVLLFVSAVTAACPSQSLSETPVTIADFDDGALDMNEAFDWFYHPENDTTIIFADFAPAQWQPVALGLPHDAFPEEWQGNGWFQTTVHVDSTLYGEQMGIGGRVAGAMEVYLNGRKVGSVGRIGTSAESEEGAGYFEPVIFRFDSLATQHLMLRYSNHNYKPGWNKASVSSPVPAGPILSLDKEASALQAYREVMDEQYHLAFTSMVRGGFLLALAVLHFLLLWFYPPAKLNGILGLVLLWLSLVSFSLYLAAPDYPPGEFIRYVQAEGVFGTLFNTFNVYLAYRLIEKQWDVWWALFAAANVIIIGLLIIDPILFRGFAGIMFALAIIWAIGLLVYARFRYNKIELNLILAGYVIGLVLLIPRLLMIFFELESMLWAESSLMLMAGILAIPLSYSTYFARDFARTHLSLERKLQENKRLAEDNLKKEQENRRLIENRKQELEEEVAKRTSDLEKAYQNLEASHKDLKATQEKLIHSEKMASLGELTAGIAHEIKNPLNFVNNFSGVTGELLEELREELNSGSYKSDDDQQVEEDLFGLINDIETNIKTIEKHGNRADKIVKDMLQHSRGSAGDKQLTDINALVDEYTNLAYHAIRAQDQQVMVNIIREPDELVKEIKVVPQDLSRALLNIINNGLQASWEHRGKQAQLIVATRKSEEGVEIKIRDNGPGIPERDCDKIFEPFFTTKPAGDGTGLGLSLTYDIIKAHGGEIEVDTEEGSYTEFTVYLPDQ